MSTELDGNRTIQIDSRFSELADDCYAKRKSAMGRQVEEKREPAVETMAQLAARTYLSRKRRLKRVSGDPED